MTVNIVELVNLINEQHDIVEIREGSPYNDGYNDGLQFVLNYLNKKMDEYDKGQSTQYGVYGVA